MSGGLGLKWLAGNRVHGASLLPAADRESGTLAHRGMKMLREGSVRVRP
jgi:hypothetical protein